MTGSQLIEAKYGSRMVNAFEIDYWLRQFDEERAPQYDDLAHFGLANADRRAYRDTKRLFEEFGE